MRDDLGIGFGGKLHAPVFKFAPQLGEILDDAIVHDGNFFGGVRMGIVLAGTAMGRPAGVADPDPAGERLAGKPVLEILELALGAPSRELAVFQRRNTRRIVAAIFEALERIDQMRRRRLTADDSDNAAHARYQISGSQVSENLTSVTRSLSSRSLIPQMVKPFTCREILMRASVSPSLP